MRPARPDRRRRGALLAQAVIATALLIVALGATARLLGNLALARLAAERRQVAVEAAANAIERVALAGPAGRTAEGVAALELDHEAAALLPGGRLTATLGMPDDAGLCPLAVEVRWGTDPDRAERPVRLVAWFAAEGRP